jgi:hypothetical protein
LVVKAAKKRTGSYSRDRSDFQGSREIAVDYMIAVACLIGFLSIFILAVVYVLHEMWIRSDWWNPELTSRPAPLRVRPRPLRGSASNPNLRLLNDSQRALRHK